MATEDTDRITNESMAERLLLRGREVATLLGISRAQAFRWMQNGTLPTLRIRGSRTVRVPRAALLRFIEDKTRQGGEQQ
jgi:excisionase family DNA binding protein